MHNAEGLRVGARRLGGTGNEADAIHTWKTRPFLSALCREKRLSRR